MQKPSHKEDDGHTIADMSGLERPSLFGSRQGSVPFTKGANRPRNPKISNEPPLEGKERWMFLLGAMKASLLIGLAYIGGLALLIFLLLLLWSR